MDLPPPLLSFVMMLPSDCEMWHLSDVASAGHVYVDVIMKTALGPFSRRARPFQNEVQVIDPITTRCEATVKLSSHYSASCLINSIDRRAISMFHS